jgi:hypothetical protein
LALKLGKIDQSIHLGKFEKYIGQFFLGAHVLDIGFKAVFSALQISKRELYW